MDYAPTLPLQRSGTDNNLVVAVFNPLQAKEEIDGFLMYTWNRLHRPASPLRRFAETGSSAIIFHCSLTGCFP